MSKLLYICFKDSVPENFSDKNFNILSDRLQPDNIKFPQPKIIRGEKELIAIFNYNESILIHGKSVCLGKKFARAKNWWSPNEEISDGTYAIFRADGNYFEAITDTVATRTIWYYQSDEIFMASTSQRAIIFFLENFEFNNFTIPWMLSSGSLGPYNSWDKRIKMLKGNSTVKLDRIHWEVTINSKICEFVQVDRNEEDNKKELTLAIKETFDNLELDYKNWVLPLSGGYDSRGILWMLKEIKELRCITWGVEASQHKKGNDAYIAKELAEYYNKEHKYYYTDLSNEPIEKIFQRFLICGEGRVDHISGYLDGFKIWKDLFEEGVQGVIRGDVMFGMSDVLSEMDVRFRVGMPILSDFKNMKKIESYGIDFHQKIPDWLLKDKNESLETYRDRLFHEYRHANVLAALNDLKLSFVEVINPQVSSKILTVVKQLPDSLRTQKKLYKEIINSICPSIPFATSEAVINHTNILEQKEILKEIIRGLTSDLAKAIFDQKFIDLLLNNLKQKDETFASTRFKIRSYLKGLLSKRLRRFLRNTISKPTMNFNELAFRAYIIVRMNKILIDDSKSISNLSSFS